MEITGAVIGAVVAIVGLAITVVTTWAQAEKEAALRARSSKSTIRFFAVSTRQPRAPAGLYDSVCSLLCKRTSAIGSLR